ncbi:hypothetical protein M0813_20200 [Anaeramoeba flamelloides]|uniref:Uncharacterized protein n=1 Tax=Anaeramoeba flamelloides TaxID=1746091 RepID=A0ABQ8YMD4_9EUKA|nr:hypothetical protein M0813_20200 [Anaeramoeba flamelloides]
MTVSIKKESKYSHLLKDGETLIAEQVLLIPFKEDKQICLILTNRRYAKVEMKTQQVKWFRDLWSINNVVLDSDSIYLFHLVSYKTSKSRFRRNSESIHNHLNNRQYLCESEEKRDEIVNFFTQALREYHQRLFELNFIRNPEIYQTHSMLIKINRKGKRQIRCLSFSNISIYNIIIKLRGMKPAKILWKINWTNLSKIILFSNNPLAFAFELHKTHLKNRIKKNKLNNYYTFISQNLREKLLIVEELHLLYFNKTGEQIQIEEKNFHSYLRKNKKKKKKRRKKKKSSQKIKKKNNK